MTHGSFASVFLLLILIMLSYGQKLILRRVEGMCQPDQTKEMNDKLIFYEKRLNTVEKELEHAVRALAELKSVDNSDSNLAKNKQTSQSSTYRPWCASEKAVDGLALDRAGKCLTQTHTSGRDLTPWWTVDLGKSYNIEHVMFIGRTDKYLNRLHDINISVGDTLQNLNKTCGFYKGPPQPREWVKIHCLQLTKGRFVKLSKAFSTYEPFLELCEVKVKGY